MTQVLLILSLLLGAIILVPSGAHLLELPRKVVMAQDAYFTVQQVYLGWSLFSIPIGVKLLLDVVVAVRLRADDTLASNLAWASASLIALGLIIFFVWVQPANVATRNWAFATANWKALRQQWEYGHAAIAVVTLLALCLTSFALSRAPGS